MMEHCQRYRRYLETLTLDTLNDLERYVAPDVHFKDPFNDVVGSDSLRRVFSHMFASLSDIRFEVDRMAVEADTCFMNWRFSARMGGNPWAFNGVSVVRFTEGGLVQEHIDQWDAAGAFYERLPLIGWLLRKIRARLAIR